METTSSSGTSVIANRASKARRELPFRLRNFQKVSNDQPQSAVYRSLDDRCALVRARLCAYRYAAARKRERVIARGSPLNHPYVFTFQGSRHRRKLFDI